MKFRMTENGRGSLYVLPKYWMVYEDKNQGISTVILGEIKDKQIITNDLNNVLEGYGYFEYVGGFLSLTADTFRSRIPKLICKALGDKELVIDNFGMKVINKVPTYVVTYNITGDELLKYVRMNYKVENI